MGGSISVQTVVQRITNEVNNTLINNAGASATANCIVTIGTIGFVSSNNCAIKIANNCSASATAAIGAVSDAVIKLFNNMTDEQQNAGAQLFTASLNIQTSQKDLVNDFNTYIENNCKTDALLNNVIKIENISYGSCSASTPMDLTFINTGQASANCVINVVNKILVEATNQQSASLSNTNSNMLIILGLIVLAGLAASIIIVYMLKGIFIMSPKDKIKLELAKKTNPDIFTRYTHNFYDMSVKQNKNDIKPKSDVFSKFNLSNQSPLYKSAKTISKK